MSTAPGIFDAPTGRRPIAPADRIETLDVLRGFAVLGILVVNAAWCAWPWYSVVNPMNGPFPLEDAADVVTWTVAHVFFENKLLALFSMLFGAGLLLLGGERADRDGTRLLRRRLAWLGVFGLVHGALLWAGDILFVYAVAGLAAMLCRSWSPRRLFWVGGALVVVGGLVYRGSVGLIALASPDEQAELAREIWTPAPGTIEAAIAAMQGGLASATAANFHEWWSYVLWAVPLFSFWYTLGLMLVGMGLLRTGFLAGTAGTRIYVGWMVAATLALLAIGWQAATLLATRFEFPAAAGTGQLAQALLSPVVTLGYASALLLACRAGLLPGLRARLAAVGRMAFTNYIAQTLIMTTIFWSGRGLGLFGEVDRPLLYSIVVAVWIAQLAWSPWWLARYRMGPLERLWRRLAYGRPAAAGASAA